MTRGAPWLMAVALAACACKQEETAATLVDRARFGVFFGGQVQDRDELLLELDQSKQSIGIRVDFKKPLERELTIGWELSLPARGKNAAPDGGDRVVQYGEATARVGQSRLDVPLAFRPGDPAGVWHVRVKVGQAVVIDRDVTVRTRSELADGGE